ncbi:MAG: peptidylprolyl isomerase [Desulfobulbaceae bacterium]|nr:peptidylprolyl isomerase [Desulfobulbaceae bacterium]
MSRPIATFITFLCLLTLLSAHASGGVEPLLVDRCVAVVNDDIITLSELNEEAAPTIKKIMELAPPEQVDSAIEKARKDILSEMIDRKLIFQRAAKRGIEVSEADIDSAIERILEQNNLTVEQFRAQLDRMGSSEEKYRETLHSQIIRSKLIGYEIRSKVVITDEQIEDYYNNSSKNTTSSPGFHILQFGNAWGENGRSSSKDDAEKRAHQLRDMIAAGENFKELAKTYSDLPSAEDGGDIGTFQKDELAPYMWNAIKDLRPGDVSDVIETPSGFQFFKLISSSQDGIISQAPLETIKEEIRATLYEEELKKKFDNWVKLLRDNSYVEELL